MNRDRVAGLALCLLSAVVMVCVIAWATSFVIEHLAPA